MEAIKTRNIEQIWIWLPRNYNRSTIAVDITHLNAVTTITKDVLDGEFHTQIMALGIPIFNLKINNTNGKYNDFFAAGDRVRLYADYGSATTLQFQGVVDFVKETVDERGRSLEIEGRHRSYILAEKFVSRAYSTQTADAARKDIVDRDLKGLGFTYAGVEASTVTIKRNFSDKPIYQAFLEIDKDAGEDSYVNNSLDIISFLKNSKTTDTEAIIEGENLIPNSIRNFGINSIKTADRIKAYGKDDAGMLIINTSGTGNREIRLTSENATTSGEVEAIADATFDVLSAVPPEGSVMSYGIEAINPGYLMVVSSPTLANVHAYYRVIHIAQIIGRSGWLTRVYVEDEARTEASILRDRVRQESNLVQILNPNNMDFSVNFDFNSNTGLTLTGLEVVEGKLRIISGETTGTMTSSTTVADGDVTTLEVRAIGSDLPGAVFSASLDGGTTFQTVTPDSVTTLGHSGKSIRLRIVLTQNTTTAPNPQIASAGLFYKI